MKNSISVSIFLCLSLFLSLMSLSEAKAESLQQVEVETVYKPPLEKDVFVPPGFDDLDNFEMVYISRIPNACYLKTYNLSPIIDTKNKVIKVTNLSKRAKSDYCAMGNNRVMYIPTVLKLGDELGVGEYTVQFATGPGEFKSYQKFKISKSTVPTIDEFEYAFVDENQLTVEVDRNASKVVVNLAGNFINGCYAFKEIKILQRTDRVVEILPITEKVTDTCTMQIQFYNKRLEIPYDVTQETRKLIHIRTANGHSLNRIVALN